MASDLTINGITLAACIKAGAVRLEKNESVINQLNVFPVPDGDTGSNMLTTLRGGLNNAKPCENLGEYMQKLARGMLFGARGNSGVIYSMIFSGIADALKDKESATVREMLEALDNGAKVAYSSAAVPTEGTILTVAREGAEGFADTNLDQVSIWEFFGKYIENIKASLDRTPELLPVLKSAGVVDSGGYGYVKFFEGFTESALNGTDADDISADMVNMDVSTKWLEDSEEDAFGFCTECIIILNEDKRGVRGEVVEYLESVGQSVVCVEKDDILKLHVHTLDPLKTLTYLHDNYGEFFNVKIENMDTMFQTRKGQSKEEKQEKTSEDYEVSVDLQKIKENLVHEAHSGITYIAVANGDGIIDIMHDSGCEIVLNGGQTMNTSVEEFVMAFEQVDTTDIVVMPNNSNIEAAARQAAKLFGEDRVHIIPTRSVAEGYFAMSMTFSYDAGVEEVVKQMTEGIRNIDTIWISKAIRDAVVDGVECHEGEYLALLDKGVVATSQDRFEAVKAAMEKIPDMDEKAIVLVFKGKEANDEECDMITELVEDTYGIDVGIVDGGQEVYDYVIGVMG